MNTWEMHQNEEGNLQFRRVHDTFTRTKLTRTICREMCEGEGGIKTGFHPQSSPFSNPSNSLTPAAIHPPTPPSHISRQIVLASSRPYQICSRQIVLLRVLHAILLWKVQRSWSRQERTSGGIMQSNAFLKLVTIGFLSRNKIFLSA